LRLRLRVVPTAERQIRAAARWWHANRPAAADLLQEELEKAFHLVTTQPEIAPAAPNVTTPGVRRFHLSRVHYHLYYRLKSDEVEVLAFWHVARGSGPKI
jgi:plasmid stabilization system protein ParE